MLARGLRFLSPRWVHSTLQKSVPQIADGLASTSAASETKKNDPLQLRKPKLQRDEVLSSKVYYAPEWDLDKKPNKDADYPNPLKNYGVTPEKWEYYNKVVWPPHYVVPEIGLPKSREVFHCRESQLKSCKILAEVLTEAKDRAANEFHIEFPSDMFVAEAFPVQCQIIKGARRHAHENWCTIRYRYINIFVRLQEGTPPGFKLREKLKNGWEHMEAYYEYLRSRTKKYSI
uniref:39S ribosomal protein L22, mitochondrial n=1 Tax=Haemonchus contortus TaxID=6289 RepID=A0A7I5E973_HAECO